MTDEAVTIELKPGDKYNPDATFMDLTKKVSWSILSDEESRRVDYTRGWENPNTYTLDGMLSRGARYAASEKAAYLAEYSETETGYSYLGYDGIYSATPVNQIPDNRKWEPHLCRIAHDVDQFNIDAIEFRKNTTYKDVPLGVHSPETQIRNQNTMQVFRAMVGDALRRLDRWAKLDPREGGSGAFSRDWKAQREGIRVIIEDKVCQACEHQYSPRQFARLHDYSAWRTALDHRHALDDVGTVSMRVPMIDRTSEPWAPHPTENLARFGGNTAYIDQNWYTAIEWYDEAVHRYDRLYAPRYEG